MRGALRAAGAVGAAALWAPGVGAEGGQAAQTPRATTPAEADWMHTNRAQFFSHTAPATVQANPKTHGAMMLFAGSGNPDLAEEISAWRARWW